MDDNELDKKENKKMLIINIVLLFAVTMTGVLWGFDFFNGFVMGVLSLSLASIISERTK